MITGYKQRVLEKVFHNVPLDMYYINDSLTHIIDEYYHDNNDDVINVFQSIKISKDYELIIINGVFDNKDYRHEWVKRDIGSLYGGYSIVNP